CAWPRYSLAAGGRGYRPSVSGGNGSPQRFPAWTHDTLRADGSCRTALAGRFMDAYRWSPSSGFCVVGHLPAPIKSFELDFIGDSRCRPGTARTWWMVSRCSLVWMEAGRASGTKELALTPFL